MCDSYSGEGETERVTVTATSTVTAQLWDFGVLVESLDWRRPSALWGKKKG